MLRLSLLFLNAPTSRFHFAHVLFLKVIDFFLMNAFNDSGVGFIDLLQSKLGIDALFFIVEDGLSRLSPGFGGGKRLPFYAGQCASDITFSETCRPLPLAHRGRVLPGLILQSDNLLDGLALRPGLATIKDHSKQVPAFIANNASRR